MTSPMDHRGLEVLTPDACDALLAATPIGRVAFLDKGNPLILPVTYVYIDRMIVFRTGVGAKLEAAAREEVVGFEIDGWDADAQTGWSVVVSGRAQLVDDPDVIIGYESMGLPAWAAPDRVSGWVRIRPLQITGRRIN